MITIALLFALALTAVGYGLFRFNAYCADHYAYNFLSGWNVVVCCIGLLALACSLATSSPESFMLFALGAAILVTQWFYLAYRTSLICATLGMFEIWALSTVALILVGLTALALADGRAPRRRF